MDSWLVFEWIEISGLMSFPPDKPQKLILDTKKLTTIVGENLDVGNGDQNGVGKSAIIDAIRYLYFGKSPRISNQGLLNYIDPGAMFVRGAARRGEMAFLVERGDNPSVIRLFEKPAGDPRDFRTKEAGKLIFETTKSKPETTKRIAELIGFDLKLTDVLLFNDPSEKSCFYLKVEEEQRAIIERIFGFTIFTEKADRIRELRKEEMKNLTTKESAFLATKQANERILVEIAELEKKSNAWAAERDKLIRLLTQQISTYKVIDFNHEILVLGQLDKLVKKLTAVEQEQKTHETSLGVLKHKHQRWQDDHLMSVNGVRKLIEERRRIDVSAEIETIRLRLQIDTEIHNLTAEINAAQRERDPYKQSLEANHTQKSRLVKQISVTENEIIQLNEQKCPTCGQDWADTKDHILNCIAELDAQSEETLKLDTTIKNLKDKIRSIDEKADKLDMKLTGLTQQRDELPATTFTTIEEATKASASLEEQVHKLDEMAGQTNPHTEMLDEVAAKVAACTAQREQLRHEIQTLPKTYYEEYYQAVKNKDEFDALRAQFTELQQANNPYRDTIDNLRTNALKEVDETEVRELKRRTEHMKLLIGLLADRDSPIRKAVLHEWLPDLNSRINTYLEFLELPHRICFDANMTATFVVNNKTCAFGNLSTGQRLRVWLATNRAFREIFELINYPINLFWVDELLDKGISARGAEMSYRLLEQMVEQDRSVFLITHRSELVDMSTKTLTVTMENGLSTMVH